MARIILTGGNDGIGFYMASQFLGDGHMVAVFDLNTNSISSLKEKFGERLLVFECDVCDAQSVTQGVNDAALAFGGIDYAIHNACKCLFTSIENTSADDYRSVFDVNFYGAVNLTKAVLNIMKAQSKGRIFYTSSGVGVMGFVNISAYASSKGALESLAKCMSIEYKGTGITFHLIHPPLTNTASAKPLPVPEEFKADPRKVGVGIARNIHKKRFIICHSFPGRVQTRMAYLLSTKLGSLMSRMAGHSDSPTSTPR